jgi:hypothetical protein
VVDPAVVTDSNAGTYSSLEAAIADARPGDEIQIKAEGELGVNPVQLKTKALSDLTVRPFPGSHPVLTFGETTDADAVLFGVQDGKLQLVDLEFLVRPRGKFDAQVLVALAGDGQCVFKNCVITLDRGGQTTTTLAVATVPEVGKVMKTDMPTARPREQGPQLSFENCFVRGDGDLVWARTSRPFELTATGTLAALTNSFLKLEVRPDAPAAPSGQKVVVQLKDVTTYLGGHLVQVGAERDLKGLVRIDCRATNCLFLPPSAGRALVQLDVPETDERTLREKIQWSGEHSAYGKFEPMLEQQTSGEETPVPAFDLKKWQTFFRDSAGRFDNVRLAVPPAELAALPGVLPEQFQPAEEVLGFGADLMNLMKLPRPAGGRGAESK